ncbi:type III secretion protein [Siculibacillus lacustris]|uniref:Type III secretion protein n=1 Tax=Siculibacillus lacustris TaxID=1549641 RepID=A0A4Q9VE62_9HYPH|nr:EscU/YscU/HrcU family type III secretion system export apparatus switch protein [Siculibacillus lacustris]TBW33022.1 type III secretion protein [Siculibacillus lacustris]
MSGDDRRPDGEKLAVALRWEAPGAPVVVAKGRGAVAEAILATAAAADVMVEENPLLATALAAVELDTPIPEALYKAVAEVIAFVLRASGQKL